MYYLSGLTGVMVQAKSQGIALVLCVILPLKILAIKLKQKSIMGTKKIIMALVVVLGATFFTSCDKAGDETVPQKVEKVKKYDSTEGNDGIDDDIGSDKLGNDNGGG